MKAKRAILFDLDGTLLPMDQDVFTKGYFRLLAAKLAPYGYDPQLLISSLWKGVSAMVKNNGKETNSQRFWETFNREMGRDCRVDDPIFDSFYRNEFHGAKEFTQPNHRARALVAAAREKADLVILSTNPIFPRCGQQSRLSWLGLSDTEFDWVTDYDNSHFCKPNPAYFREILERFSLHPEDCLLVGNDMEEDRGPAEALGIPSFLITDCLINPQNRPVAAPCGTADDALAFLQTL